MLRLSASHCLLMVPPKHWMCGNSRKMKSESYCVPSSYWLHMTLLPEEYFQSLFIVLQVMISKWLKPFQWGETQCPPLGDSVTGTISLLSAHHVASFPGTCIHCSLTSLRSCITKTMNIIMSYEYHQSFVPLLQPMVCVTVVQLPPAIICDTTHLAESC